jgi:hypothetical protein
VLVAVARHFGQFGSGPDQVGGVGSRTGTESSSAISMIRDQLWPASVEISTPNLCWTAEPAELEHVHCNARWSPIAAADTGGDA